MNKIMINKLWQLFLFFLAGLFFISLPSPIKTETLCTESDWICAAWTPCTASAESRNRVCFKANVNCNGGYVPISTEACANVQMRLCSEEDWVCTPWGACGAGQKQRTCALQALDCRGGYVAQTTMSCVQSTPTSTIGSSGGGNSNTNTSSSSSNSSGSSSNINTNTSTSNQNQNNNSGTYNTSSTTGNTDNPVPVRPVSETNILPQCTDLTVGWRCTTYTECDSNGWQYRTCDYNRHLCTLPDASIQDHQRRACTASTPSTPVAPGVSPRPRPATSCSEDVWDCSTWGNCQYDINGNPVQKRTCIMRDNCSTAETPTPETSRICFAPISENSGPTCRIPGFIRPAHTSSISGPQLCEWNYRPNGEIRLGQELLSVVWGSPFRFTVPDKEGAMGTALAGYLFNYEPNYLNAIATKESRAYCIQVNHDGCHQIEAPSFRSLTERFPLHLSGAHHSEYVERWGRSALVAAFHYRMSESLFRLWFNWDEFGRNSVDREAQTKLLTRAYNRGQWDPNIRQILTSRWNECVAAPDITSCYDNHDIALDHTIAVLSYCRAYVNSENIYDTFISWNEIDSFIDEIVSSVYRTSQINWIEIKDVARNYFNCLKDENDVISFRYDLGVILNELKNRLPRIQEPVDIIRDYGHN